MSELVNEPPRSRPGPTSAGAQGMLSVFVATLRTQVDQSWQALAQARDAGDLDQMHRHGARLLDLLEGAASHGVDTTDWVSAELVSLASTAAGDGS